VRLNTRIDEKEKHVIFSEYLVFPETHMWFELWLWFDENHTIIFASFLDTKGSYITNSKAGPFQGIDDSNNGGASKEPRASPRPFGSA